MTRSAYYGLLKAKARELRLAFGLNTPRVTLSDLRRIYKAHGIGIDYWKGSFKTVRGQYSQTADGPCVMVSAKLPDEQRISTLAHELKHHFFDQAESALLTENEPSEIGAEIFAVELIFPDSDFVAHLEQMGVQRETCTREHIVRLKHETRTTLSYGSLAKRAEFMGYAAKGSLGTNGWMKLRDTIYGEPAYKRIQRYRQQRARTQ
ncbi:MAG: ImmA/IrrE family metallo-endopeptidase [bacterium]|nr:ImmA/IrrE family metallo-endopeptidase [bacterium]